MIWPESAFLRLSESNSAMHWPGNLKKKKGDGIRGKGGYRVFTKLTNSLLMPLHSVDVPQPHKIKGVKGRSVMGSGMIRLNEQQ